MFKITVFIVDDHPTVRDGLKLCLSAYQDLDIIGEAGSGQEALELIENLRPDVVLMDVSMPGMNGIDTAELVIEQYPETKVLMFSMHEDTEFVTTAVEIGAMGYVLKNTNSEEVYCAIRSIYNGGTHFSSAIAKRLVGNPVKSKGKRLTTREQNILSLITKGMCNKEIARSLNISVRTVEAHRRNIKAKIGCNSIAEMIAYAMEQGLHSRD